MQTPTARRPGPVVVGTRAIRLLAVVAVAAGTAALLARLALVVVPVAVAIVLAGLLTPPVRLLVRHRVPRPLAAGLVLVAALAGLAGLATVLAGAVGDSLPALVAELSRGLAAVVDAASGVDTATGGLPARAVTTTLVTLARDGLAVLAGDPQAVTAALGAGLVPTLLGLVVTVAVVVFAALLTVFVLAVLLNEGPRVWWFLLRAVPAERRPAVAERGARAFAALVAHLRGVLVVAFLGAVGSGVVLGALGSPLAGPVAATVLLGGFVPVVGPLVAGAATVLVALATAGPVGAGVTAAVGIGLSLLGHRVVVPRVLGGRAPAGARPNPVAVVLAVAAGIVLAGAIGALLAVPALVVLTALRVGPPDDAG
ncbi:AI-2E family transporter [Actinomycetospora endophytica]|uniref:AI-2E family transporter n=1 Tax=Actinomycetospora endophytica TaxID=2291215 RepID=A0ABS8P6N7_9PSEU|nr:AI-2E family transporter [Actinomycetospora endophytica]MCD2193076.1 AI-2E family transporter [Actinomycetospora endophytica]